MNGIQAEYFDVQQVATEFHGIKFFWVTHLTYPPRIEMSSPSGTMYTIQSIGGTNSRTRIIFAIGIVSIE